MRRCRSGFASLSGASLSKELEFARRLHCMPFQAAQIDPKPEEHEEFEADVIVPNRHDLEIDRLLRDEEKPCLKHRIHPQLTLTGRWLCLVVRILWIPTINGEVATWNFGRRRAADSPLPDYTGSTLQRGLLGNIVATLR
jgi:hypothetical protein